MSKLKLIQKIKFKLANLYGVNSCVYIVSASTIISISISPVVAVESKIERRRQVGFTEMISRPFPSPICRTPPTVADRCTWGQLVLILAQVFRHELASDNYNINVALTDSIERIRNYTVNLESHADPAYGLHFLTGNLLFRILKQGEMFNDQHPSRISQDVRDKIVDLFGTWAKKECRIVDTDPKNDWRIWGSENHALQHNHTCWAAASLMSNSRLRSSFIYDDNSNVLDQLHAWSRFIKNYLKRYAKHGMFIEFFSPTYTDYTLASIYNFFDFGGDEEMRGLARSFLDLWWALWAQEQLNGTHGGSKTRAYPSELTKSGPADGLGWLYFGLSEPSRLRSRPTNIVAMTSGYEPPAIIKHIALRPAAREPYEVWSRVLGVAALSRTGGFYYPDSDNSGVLRYAYVTPDFIMGSAMRRAYPEKHWMEISSQNTWSGLTMQDGSGSRVYVTSEPEGGLSTYNAMRVVQLHGAQLIQKNEGARSKGSGNTIIVVGRGLCAVNRSGWIFSEGAAYVAVRPLRGGVSGELSSTSCAKAQTITANREETKLVLNDSLSPVVIQAARRSDFPTLDDFQQAVIALRFNETDSSIIFETLGGAGNISLPKNLNQMVMINGKPVDFGPIFEYRSPYVNANWGSGLVQITDGVHKIELKF